MAGNIDGNIDNDPSVIHALAGSNLERLPESFDDSDSFEHLEISNLFFTAGDLLITAPSDPGSRIKPGRIKLLSTKQIFKLIVTDSDLWTLILIGSDTPNRNDETTVTINKDQLLKHLKYMLSVCEKSNHYLSLGSRLHKEAVQDAVDIVQSKRIDFVEAKSKQIDVTGILISVLIIVFFEAGIAATTGAAILKIFKDGQITKKLFEYTAYLVGKNANKFKENLLNSIRQEQKKLTELLDKNNQLVSQMRMEALVTSQISRARAQIEKNGQLTKIEVNKIEATIANNKDIEELLVVTSRGSAISRGKEILSNSIKKGEEFLAKNSKGLIKDSSNLVNNKIRGNSFNSTVGQVLPIEIYLKTYFQDLFEEEVSISEKYVHAVKSTILYIECLDAIPDNFPEIFKHLPQVEILQMQIDDLSKEFDENFKFAPTKEKLTKKYEFLIWSIYFSKHVMVTPFNLIDTLLLNPSLPSDDEDRLADMENTDNPEVSISISPPTLDYLTQRFQMDEPQLAYELLKSEELLKNQKNEVNRLLKDDEAFFIVDYTVNPK